MEKSVVCRLSGQVQDRLNEESSSWWGLNVASEFYTWVLGALCPLKIPSPWVCKYFFLFFLNLHYLCFFSFLVKCKLEFQSCLSGKTVSVKCDGLCPCLPGRELGYTPHKTEKAGEYNSWVLCSGKLTWFNFCLDTVASLSLWLSVFWSQKQLHLWV